MASGKKSSKSGPRNTRNPELIRGVRKFGSSTTAKKAFRFKHVAKGLGKSQPKKVKSTRQSTLGRYYSAEDVKVPLRSHKPKKSVTKLRKSLKPGTVVVLLAGRFRGKRVVFLKQLQSGLLLVTGPYKVNGVPLRRVNQAYVIATSTTVDVSKADVSKINDQFFAKDSSNKSKSKDGEAFFNKDEKKNAPSDTRKSEQKRVDTVLLASLKSNPVLRQYLNAKFSLRNGQRPHLLKF